MHPPQPDRWVFGTRGQATVRQHFEREDRAAVTFEAPGLGAGIGIPQPDRAVPRPRRQAAVGQNCQRVATEYLVGENVEVNARLMDVETGTAITGQNLNVIYDDDMKATYEEASAAGKKLRYVGRLDAGGNVAVGLESVDATHPFSNINLTDNIVQFESDRYSANPLYVQGPGAGPEVTAGGVFAELLHLSKYLSVGD